MASINASTSGGGGVIVTSDATGNLNIQSGGSTVVAVTSAGAAVTGTLSATGASTFTGTGKFATTIGVGNATPSASGSGITFPATQSASSDANTLDDYEEGTWTAVPTWATQGTGSGNVTAQYTKVGNLVSVRCYPIAVKGTASGVFKITGLPFTSSENTACSIRVDAAGAASKVLQSIVVGTEIRFSLMNQSTTYAAELTATDMNGSCYMNIQCTYQI